MPRTALHGRARTSAAVRPAALSAAVLDRRAALRLTAASLLAAGAATGASAVAAAPSASALTAGEPRSILVDCDLLRYARESSAVRFRLRAGTQVTLTGNQVGEFVGIRHPRAYGWVRASQLGPQAYDGKILHAAHVLLVHSGASETQPVRFLYGSGAGVTLTGRVVGGWYGVRRRTRTGWVHVSGFAEAGLPPVQTSDVWIAKTAELRAEPSSAAASLRILVSGDRLTLTGQARSDHAAVTDGRVAGWVHGPALSTLPTAPAARPATRLFSSHTADGRTYGYHVVADGIDYSRPVGMAVYLEGDYWHDSSSVFKTPTSTRARAMAAEANRRNMVLVVPQTPRPLRDGYGYIWWWGTEREGNNVWLTSLLQDLYGRFPMLDRSRHWFLGYSGGAEFATFEFFARNPESVMSGGGAVLVAGGGMVADWFPALPSEAFRRSVSLQWYVGDQDGVGSTNPPTWSAYNATAEGEAAYRAVGFTNTSRTVLTGLDHVDYDLPGLLARGLDRGGITPLR